MEHQLTQRMDGLTVTVEQVTQRLDDFILESQRMNHQLTQRMDGLTVTVERVTQRVDQLTLTLEPTIQQQAQTAVRLDHIEHTQRLLGQYTEQTQQHAGRLDRLDGVAAMLIRLQDRQQIQLENQQTQITNQQTQIEEMRREFGEHRRTTNAALERIDRLLDYLIQRS